MRRAIWLHSLILAGLAAPAFAGPGVWTTNGPDGGEIRYLVIDAAAPDTLVAATRGGVFRSTDAGGMWSRFEDGLLYDFSYGLEAADSTSTMYLSSSATTLYRSTGGGHWMPTGFSPGAGGYLFDLSLRPGGDQFLAAASSAGLYLSSDGAATFTHVAGTGLPDADAIARIEYASATRLYAAYNEPVGATTAQVYRSNDAGSTWTATADLPFGGDYVPYHSGDLEAAPSNPDRVYFASQSNAYVSSNGGASWTACGATGINEKLHVEPGNADHVWLASNVGVLRSVDGCATWTALDSGLSADGARTAYVTGIAFPPGFPADSRIFAGTASGGVFRSIAGAAFTAQNDGLTATNVRAIGMHPVDASRILLGYGDTFTPSPALYASADGGSVWSRSNAGMRATQIRSIAIDPTTAASPASTHVYAVGSSRPSYDFPDASNTDGGVYKSTDGGATWSTIDSGFPATYLGGLRYIGSVRNVVLDPRSCAFPPASGACSAGPLQTAYITASGRPDYVAGSYAAARVYKSTDAGAHWSAAENGLPSVVAAPGCNTSQIAIPLVVDPNAPNTLYLGLALSGSAQPPCPVPSIPNGIFKSIDGGASWTHASAGLPSIGAAGTSQWNVFSLAIDPANSNVIYAGVYDDTVTAFVGRVYKSTDAGATWNDSSVGISGADVRAILIDPDDSSIVYAGTGGSPTSPSGIYRSTDAGLTWNSFSIGLPTDAATALAIDPHNHSRLLAGTGGGLWELTQVPDADSDGAATSTENAAPNGGDANADGAPDAGQSNVASFFGVNASTLAASAQKGAPQPQVTLSVAGITGNCQRINNAHALSGESLPADTARGVAPSLFDRGVLRFELPDCQRAYVTVQFHGADYSDIDWTWRNYGPLTPGDAASFAWYTFAGARKTGPGRWELTVDATQRGSYRRDPDAILFVGAPAFVDLSVFRDGLE